MAGRLTQQFFGVGIISPVHLQKELKVDIVLQGEERGGEEIISKVKVQ